jgi:integrase
MITKQCYCSKCRREYTLAECTKKEDGHYCPVHKDKWLRAELIRNKTKIDKLEVGLKDNGQQYSMRTNRDAYLSPEQWIDFMKRLNFRQKLSCMFLIHTGGRVMEVQHLKPENVVRPNRYLTFEVTKKRSARGERRCKERQVSLSTLFFKWYDELDMDRAVKKNGYFDIMSDAGINTFLKRILREMNVTNWYMFSAHNIRKTHENWMMSVFKDLTIIAKRLGHTPETAMSTYIQERHFTAEQNKLIVTILGDDIYVD